MHETLFFQFYLLFEWKYMYECMRFCFSFLNENEILFFLFNSCKKMDQTLWNAFKNAWDFILIICLMRMYVQMNETLFWSFFYENECTDAWDFILIIFLWDFIFCNVDTFRKKCIGAMRVHECMHETLFYRYLSLFKCMYVIRVHRWMDKTPFCYFCSIFYFWMRMHV